MTYVDCICAGCGKTFPKLLKEFNKAAKNGYQNTCSRSCSALYSNKIKPKKGNIDNLVCDNRQDQYSRFRYYINKARSAERKRNYGETNITVEYLKELWDSQKGICPYTGKQMELPYNTRDCNIKATPTKASLDRIDADKGYIQGNVEFVCLAVNYAKNTFSRDEMMEFFKLNK